MDEYDAETVAQTSNVEGNNCRLSGGPGQSGAYGDHESRARLTIGDRYQRHPPAVTISTEDFTY